jgi:hypothetical protein
MDVSATLDFEPAETWQDAFSRMSVEINTDYPHLFQNQKEKQRLKAVTQEQR